MACGTPNVCSDINGFRNVVAHEREALLVPCGDTTALAETLATLLDDDASRARLGAAGRQRALAYGWPRVSDMILGLYARVLGARRIAA
jgi:glycosyltransferase involved in cell wall biosynthesis